MNITPETVCCQIFSEALQAPFGNLTWMPFARVDLFYEQDEILKLKLGLLQVLYGLFLWPHVIIVASIGDMGVCRLPSPKKVKKEF